MQCPQDHPGDYQRYEHRSEQIAAVCQVCARWSLQSHDRLAVLAVYSNGAGPKTS